MTCPLCEREVTSEDLSDHHLVPRSRGGKETEAICHSCHRQVHALFDNKRLERELNTVEALKDNEDFGKYLKWVAKQPVGRRCKAKQAKGNKKRR